jgi:ATP-binding cassette subfamily B multidrug efflux pump
MRNPVLRIMGFISPYKKIALASMVMLALSVLGELFVPRLLQRIIDVGIAQKDLWVIGTTTGLMLGISIFETGMAIGNTYFSVTVAQRFAADLRSAVFRKIQSFSFGNLDKFQTGELIVRMTSDINITQMMVMMGFRMFIRAPFTIVGSILMMFNINSKLANIMLILLPLTLVLTGIFVWKAQPMFMKVQGKLDRLNNVLQENLAGIRVVKAFVRQNNEMKRFDDANLNLMSQAMKVNQLLQFLMPTMFIIINFSMVGVLYFGGLQAIQGDFTVGEILAFTNYLLASMFPLIFLGMIASQLSMAEASSKRIYEVLDMEPQVKNALTAKPVEKMVGKVAFEDVYFSYGGDYGEPVLSNINFVAEPGEVVALLGATGSGKSTLINLIPRFYDVSKGKITIDGVDIRDFTIESLRANIGMALQEPILFSGTIRDNIKYGKPEATDEEVIEAAKAAQAHDFIMSFPGGYDTEVGQRGVGLSGGQKQRISIARAILVKPKILILDDSTSSVDVETESKIQEALSKVMEGRTSFIIAQRISSVLKADKILVLERGKIVSVGDHDTLIKQSQIYMEIYNSQLGEGMVQ